jgi:hypothetical protein
VDRVVFFLDGVPVHTDYTYPFVWELDTGVLDEGSHNFGGKSFDPAGNIAEVTRMADVQNLFPAGFSPVHVRILNPESRAEVYGDVFITAKVTHALNFRICYMSARLDENIIWEKDYMERFGHCVGTPLFEGASYDFSGLEPGSTHNIYVEAEDEHGNWGHAQIQVKISEPELSISRDVTRHNNYFEVTLTIENNGEVPIDNLRVTDTTFNFQFLKTGGRRSGGGTVFGPEQPIEYEVWTSRPGHSSYISTGDLGTLEPDGAIRLKYYAVPVLLWEETIYYGFGRPLKLQYQPRGGRGHIEYPPTTCLVSSEEMNYAFSDADYLIVTNPSKLFEQNDPNDAAVNELLETTAELAKEKNGVLGNTCYEPVAGWLKGRISEGGAWYEKLAPFDYLLLVGETEIVPSFTEPCHIHFAGDGTCPICGAEDVLAVTSIRITDFPYADIYNDDELPDIKVGRIIGQTAQELIKPIKASIDVYNGRVDYDASDAYLVSGPEGSWEMFIDNLRRLRETLHFDEDIEHVCSDFMAEFYTYKHGLLQEALEIRDKEPTEFKGPIDSEDATWRDYTTNELACWLLLIEDEEVILSQIPYRPSYLTDADIVSNADRFVNQGVLDHALQIAEEVQHNRRGVVYHAYIYDDWTRAEALQHVVSSVKAVTHDKDIIIFSGHGGPGSWACVLDDWTTSDCPIEPISFGNSRPVVIAFSCLTGNYGGDSSIARAFSRNGAAVYIGATEVSPCNHNDQMETREFWNYWSKTSRIGDALFDLKTWMIERDDSMWRYVAYEYNLYGDPKFGGP